MSTIEINTKLLIKYYANNIKICVLVEHMKQIYTCVFGMNDNLFDKLLHWIYKLIFKCSHVKN